MVVTDPYDDSVGFSLSSMSADMVTTSHQHSDHNAIAKVKGTSRRERPFIIDHPGEYEVGGISVFGNRFFHDTENGAERGENIVFTILLDGMTVCHLGDLGHELSEEQVVTIGLIDVLLLPVGGVYTIDPKQAAKVARSLDPRVVIPMHYKTAQHNSEAFGQLSTVEDFVKEFGSEVTPEAKLTLEKERLPEEMELVVLNKV